MDERKVTVHDRVPISRTRTKEGFLRARAGLTRVGEFVYDAAYLGVGAKGEQVTVYRTPETVFHPDTIASLAGAPITLNHPDDADVTPENWRQLVVGNIVGTPERVGDKLEADVLIGDAAAIEALDKGVDEISVGYEMTYVPVVADSGYSSDYLTKGAMECNHSAIVPLGRAGPSIRIYDSGEGEMTPEERKQVVDETSAAVVAALAGKETTPEAVKSAVDAAVKPLADRMEQMEKDATEKQKAADEAADKKKLQDAIDEAMNKGAEIERARNDVWRDAEQFIPEDKREEVRAMDIKDILVAAVGDSVPNAKDAEEGYLRGALAMMAKDRAASGKFPGPRTGNLSGDHTRARDAMIESLKKGPSMPGAEK